MRNEFETFSIHEAGHFIVYLVNCIEEDKFPRVYELSIKRNGRIHAFIKIKHDTTASMIVESLGSNTPDSYKEKIKTDARREIKYYLAGLAAEILYSPKMDPKKALLIFYRSEKKNNNSDLSKAVALNIAIGCQQIEDGSLPLLALLEETISGIKLHWNEVIKIAKLLQLKQELSSMEIDKIIESFHIKHKKPDQTFNNH